jgi:hypothetical protein
MALSIVRLGSASHDATLKLLSGQAEDADARKRYLIIHVNRGHRSALSLR